MMPLRPKFSEVVAAVCDRRSGWGRGALAALGGHRPPLQQARLALLCLSCLLSPASLLLGGEAPAPAPTAAPPAKNWVLPLFTDKEGYRTMTLRGSAVQPVGASRIDVVDLNITVFSGDAAARVDSVLLSQAASFFPKTNVATGEKNVRLIRDDFEISGEGWSYDHTAKKISVKKNARVVFLRAELNDILK